MSNDDDELIDDALRADDAPELDEEFFRNSVLTKPGERILEKLEATVPESQLRDLTIRFNKANATIIDKNKHIAQLEDLLRRYLP